MAGRALGTTMAVAAVLAAGVVVASCAVGVVVFTALMHQLGGPRRPQSLFVRADGSLYVTTWEGRDEPNDTRDLDGNLMPLRSPVPVPPGVHLTILDPPRPVPEGPFDWEHRVRRFADGVTPGAWFLLTDGAREATGYFVGYDRTTRSRVGFLGTAGFREDEPPPGERFPVPGQTFAAVLDLHAEDGRVYLLTLDHTLYRIDLRGRTVIVIHREPGAGVVEAGATPPDDREKSEPRIFLRTADTVVVLDGDGRVLSRHPIPGPARDRTVRFALTRVGSVLAWAVPDDPESDGVDLDATVVRTTEGRVREDRVRLAAGSTPVPPAVFVPVMLPVPVILGLAVPLDPNVRREPARFAPALAAVAALAAVLAWLCHRRLVRYGAGRAERVAWPLFVLALGPPGWVGFRLARPWPVRLPCPACRAGVPRDRLACARCGADFPKPARTGTEVFG